MAESAVGHEPLAAERAVVAAAELLGVSPAIVRLRAEIRAVARGGFRAVLVQGESGVGKEVVAEALRRASTRASAPVEIFDCPAVPEDHLESELFGTARGAFPGAVDKRGALERAHGGTIFFDEIAAMRREHQAKILRAIEGKRFRRVGGTGSIAVDVAVIAAAHEDLERLAAEGLFRHDLYYRLIRDGVLVIPPLRERSEDVAVLARHYLACARGYGEPPIEPSALRRLAEYDWPGNVRQLHTALRVALRIDGRALTLEGVEHALGIFSRRPACSATAASSTLAAVDGSVRRSTLSGVVSDAAGRTDQRGASAHGAETGFHAITARVQRRALLQAYEAAAGNKTLAGILLGFHLSPGEQSGSGDAPTESRRNLALRKFRYWCSRLGVTEALERRSVAAHLRTTTTSTATPTPFSVDDV